MKALNSMVLSPSVPVIHHFSQIFYTASSLQTDLLYSLVVQPTQVFPCVGVHGRTSIICSSLLLSLVRLS